MKYFVISVDFEEWFHSNWFDPKKIMSRHYGGKAPSTDIVFTTRQLLDIFEECSVNATFFCLGETSEKYQDAIKMIGEAGHEIAFHGINHQCVGEDIEQFRESLSLGKKALEKLSGSEIVGYRAPNFKMPPWGFEALSDSGFLYDSSLVPCLKIPGWYGSTNIPTYPHKIFTKNGCIVEFPLTVFPFLRIPGCGGWFLRNFGFHWVKLLLKRHLKRNDLAILYLHPWEVSDENPRLPEIPSHVFRRTGKWTLNSLRRLIDTFKDVANFISFQQYLEDNGKLLD